MRKFLLAATVAFLTSQSAIAQLVITEAQPSSDAVSPFINGDWWELTNVGGTSVDLTGYYWDDNGPMGNDGALFPAITIAANSSIVFADVANADLADFVAAWGGGFTAYSAEDFGGPDTFSGLSSGGDQIELWDADPNAGPANLVASAVFGPAGSAGETHSWDRSGNSLGLSMIGVNGAFQAISNGDNGPGIDVGSPGVSVPEPASLALAALGLFGMFGFRRK